MLKKREIVTPTVPPTSGFTLEEAQAAVRAVYRNPATGRFVIGKHGESLAELRKRVRARNAAARKSAASAKR
jgi:hypothetical protein